MRKEKSGKVTEFLSCTKNNRVQFNFPLNFIMEEKEDLRKWILQFFKLHGFSVRADAVSYLVEQFLSVPNDQKGKSLEKVSDQIQLLNSSSLVIDKEQIEKCFKESLLDKPSSETVWNVIDVFNCPRFIYNREKCKYEKDDSVMNEGLFSNASSKSFMLRRLYHSVMQRTLRHNALKQVFTLGGKTFQYSVKTVEWFLCSTERIEHAVIVGLLVQKTFSNYAIEDVTGTLDIDISQTKFSDGFFPEHCFVFLEGTYEDKVLYVTNFGLPPPEPSKVSRPYFGEINTFGGMSEYTLTKSKALQKIEEKHSDAMIVFISDIWLDKPQVLEKLKVLFSGFSEFPPFAFVLMGNFLSRQEGVGYGEHLKKGFVSLGRIISCHENIRKNCQFVIVPGPFDVGSPRILPRPAFSKYLVEGFLSKISNVTLATNPCRIQFCTKEIVVIREDLVTKLCRNTIHFPSNATDKIPLHFTKTILSQGNLVPLSLLVCPVYWNYSHALDIHPLPDLIVASDQFNSFSETCCDCKVISPGSFVKEKFFFKVYLPWKNEVEDSCIPEET